MSVALNSRPRCLRMCDIASFDTRFIPSQISRVVLFVVACRNFRELDNCDRVGTFVSGLPDWCRRQGGSSIPAIFMRISYATGEHFGDIELRSYSYKMHPAFDTVWKGGGRRCESRQSTNYWNTWVSGTRYKDTRIDTNICRFHEKRMF